jgi:type I restriction enzyme S subunit
MATDPLHPTVGDYVTLVRGITYKGNLVGAPGPALLGLGSIEPGGGFRIDHYKTYGGECPPGLMLYPGDLYASLKGATKDGKMIGSVARVPPSVNSGRLTQDTVKLVFRAPNKRAESYIYWLLRTPQYRDYCAGRATGSAVVALSRNDFLSYPVPQLTEARECIVCLLDEIERRIEISRQMNETLEAIARAVFKDWFIDFGPTRAKIEGNAPYLTSDLWSQFPDKLDGAGKPEGWELKRIDDVLELGYGKSLPSTSRRFGKYPVYGSGGVTGYHAESLTPAPSVIVGRKGTVGSLYWEDRPCFPIDTVFYVVTKRAPLTFCFYLLQTLGLHGMNTDAAVPGLNRNNVYRLTGVWDHALAIAFDSVVRPLRERIFAGHIESSTLARTRDLLLPKLMSGEIRFKDAERVVAEVA